MASNLRAELRIQVDELRDGKLYRRCPNCGVLKEINDFGLRTLKPE